LPSSDAGARGANVRNGAASGPGAAHPPDNDVVVHCRKTGCQATRAPPAPSGGPRNQFRSRPDEDPNDSRCSTCSCHAGRPGRPVEAGNCQELDFAPSSSAPAWQRPIPRVPRRCTLARATPASQLFRSYPSPRPRPNRRLGRAHGHSGSGQEAHRSVASAVGRCSQLPPVLVLVDLGRSLSQPTRQPGGTGRSGRRRTTVPSGS
jgi:hypothetical protein